MRDTLPSTRPYWLTRRKCWTFLSIRGNGWAGRVKAERAWSPVSKYMRAVANCCCQAWPNAQKAPCCDMRTLHRPSSNLQGASQRLWLSIDGDWSPTAHHPVLHGFTGPHSPPQGFRGPRAPWTPNALSWESKKFYHEKGVRNTEE